MGRFLNRLIYIVVALAVIYSAADRFSQKTGIGGRRPPVEEAVPVPKRLPPPPLLGDGRQVVTIDVGEKANSSGTGFSVARGWWLTARHVVDGCDVVGILTGPRQGVKARRVFVHPNADAALLEIPESRKVFPFSSAALRRGQDGYSIGYPQGQPGAVHATLMGQLRMRSVGRYRIEEPVLAWAERRRIPDRLPALGGLSGGPMFDETGAVVGVLVASSDRRGRVMTTAPASLAALIDAHHLTPRTGHGDIVLSPSGLPDIGDELRRDLRIAKVVCRLDAPRRRPRR